MNLPNEDSKPTDNTELTKPPAASCGPGCGCHATGTPGKTRWVIGVIVLAAAGVMVVRTMIKSDGASSRISAPAFAALGASPTTTGESGPDTNSRTAAPSAGTSVVTSIGAIAELNTVATNLDAVFIFLPGKEGISVNPPLTPMQGAARTIEFKGLKCGLFTLKAGSRDYDQIAGQISLPGVLAMVKGRGMSAISGDITETKLVQGYVAASSAGGCCAGGSTSCK
jgi:MYXO-CTERM domain-containing protein